MLEHIQQRLERARAKRQRLGELLVNVEREIDQLEAEHGRILSEQEAFDAAAQEALGPEPAPPSEG